MQSEVLKKLYYRILYNQKLISNNSVLDLIKEENRIYNNLIEKEKIHYEINRINKYQYNLKDTSTIKLFNIFNNKINRLMSEEKSNYDEVKKLIVIIEILLNINPSFYKSLLEIDKAYLDRELSRRS